MKLPSRIRMRHLRAFLALSDHGSVTRAATALNTVQPSVSRTLRELEDELSQSLFERTAHGMIMTRAGEMLHRYAVAGMAQIERGVQQVRNLDHKASVAIGILPNVARTLVPSALLRFKQQAPDIDVRAYSAPIPGQVIGLQRGELDFLVGRLIAIEQMTGISFEQLYSEPLIFVVRAEHQLLAREHATLAAIDEHIVVVPYPETIIRKELDRFAFARGITEFSKKIETISFELARALLLSSDAVACLPIGAVKRELAEGTLVRLDISGDELIGSVGLSFLTGRELSPAAAQLADAIRQEAKAYRGT